MGHTKRHTKRPPLTEAQVGGTVDGGAQGRGVEVQGAVWGGLPNDLFEFPSVELPEMARRRTHTQHYWRPSEFRRIFEMEPV